MPYCEVGEECVSVRIVEDGCTETEMAEAIVNALRGCGNCDLLIEGVAEDMMALTCTGRRE
jgi:hypothetical protein